MTYWRKTLDRLLATVIRTGTLTLTWPDGQTSTFGAGTPVIAVRLSGAHTVRALAISPEIALGEAYMDGRLVIDGGDLHGLLSLAAMNARTAGWGRFGRIVPWARRAMRRINQNNTHRASRANVAHHYDLSVELYELFLDADLQYTCAYYPSDDLSIEAAQEAKKAHIAKKLRLEPGMRVMDIGCGWGGMAITLARDHGVHVVGVTLSEVQLAYARRRAEAAGLSHLIEIRLTDYRDVTESFDRIVVVGMLEHVGQPQYATFFSRMRQNLEPDGVALVHTIGRSTPPNVTAPWIGKYIFPGSHIPSMSEVVTEIERNDLILTDVEVWRMHYVRTLQAWRARFEANSDAIEAMYDARFVRMWRYYLVASEIGFLYLANVVFQFQITRDQQAVPLTRGYLHES